MRRFQSAMWACVLATMPAAMGATPEQPMLSAAPATSTATNGGIVETFAVGGVDFAFPVPAAYCLPKGRYETNAKVAAQMDGRNMTMVSFVSCVEMEKGIDQTRWGALKALLATVNGGSGPRKDLIDAFKSQIDPAQMQKLNKEGADEAANNLEHGLGQKLDIKIDMMALDADEAAAYSGGILTFKKADGEPLPISCVYAATIIKDRVFFLYIFSLKTGALELTTLLSEVKLATHAFVDANPEGK